MKYITVIAICVALSVPYTRLAVAEEQPQAAANGATQDSAGSGDELHFVSVLTLQGEITAIDPERRLLTLKGPNGEVLTLEARGDDLAARKVGESVQVRYFEGARIGKGERGEAVPVESLKDGMISAESGGPSAKQPALSASVERVDALNQEVTLKGPDGSFETIMVSNPEYLGHIKVGDRVVLTHPQGLALSLERES